MPERRDTHLDDESLARAIIIQDLDDLLNYDVSPPGTLTLTPTSYTVELPQTEGTIRLEVPRGTTTVADILALQVCIDSIKLFREASTPQGDK